MVEYDEYVLDVGSEGFVEVVDDGDALVYWAVADAQPKWLLRSDFASCIIISQPKADCDLEARDDVNNDADILSQTFGNLKLFGIFCGQVRLQRRLLELTLPLDYECPIDLVLPLLNHFISAERQNEGQATGPVGTLDSRDSLDDGVKNSRQKRVRREGVWEELRAELLLEIPDSQVENHAFEVAARWIRESHKIDELGRKLSELEMGQRQAREHVGKSNGQARPKCGAGVVAHQQQHQDDVGYVGTHELFEAMFQCGVPMFELMGICRAHEDHDVSIHHIAFVSRLRDRLPLDQPTLLLLPGEKRLERSAVKKDEAKANLIEHQQMQARINRVDEDIVLGDANAGQHARQEAESEGMSEGWWSLHERTGEFASGRALKRIWGVANSNILGPSLHSGKWSHQEDLTCRPQESPREVDLRDEFWKAEYESIKRQLTEKQRSLESSERELARVSRQLTNGARDSVFSSSVTTRSPTAIPQTLSTATRRTYPAQQLTPACAPVASPTQQRGLSALAPRPVQGQPESTPRPISMSAGAQGSAAPLSTARHDPFSPSRSMAQSAPSAAPMLRSSASSGHLPAGIAVVAKAVAASPDSVAPSLGVPGPTVCSRVTSVPVTIDNAAGPCALVPASSAGRASAGFANDVVALREIVRRNPDLKVLDENPWFPDTAADIAEQVGSWQGVVTKEGRVTEIHVRISCLPSAVGRLSALTTLNLTSSISLHSLPYAVGDLQCLDALRLGDCKNLGVLPASLARLPMLTRLDLWSCVCLGGLPALPTSLKLLNLNGCTSLRELPARLQECAGLQALDVGCCSSLASLPAFLGDMPGLACSRGVLDVRNCPGECSPALPRLRARGCRVQT